MTPLDPPDNIVTQMRSALAAARKAGATKEQMDFLIRAWGREIENFNEAEQTAVAMEPTDAQRQLGGIASIAKDIPGVEAVASGARSVVRGQPYTEALSDIRQGESAAPALARIPNRIIGGGLAAAALPITSPVMAGAAYGGLMNMLDADPAKPMDRALNTGVGAVAGGIMGKAADFATTGIRALRTTPGDVQIKALQAARDKMANPLYADAIEQGLNGNTNTPAIQQFLAEPDIVPIVERLSSMRQYQGMAPTHPEMLLAIRRALTDQGQAAAMPLAGYNPAAPNLAREGVENIGRAKDQFAQAVSRNLDAPMPAAEAANEAFHQGSRPIDAMLRGESAMKLGSSNAGNFERLAEEGPRGLSDWLRAGNEDLVGPAAQGALAMMKRGGRNMGVTGAGNPLQVRTRNMLWNGGDVLRMIEGTAADNAAKPLTAPTLLDALRRAGVGGLTPEGF